MFWSCFELDASSINLFTERNVDRDFFGYVIPAASIQSANPWFVIALAFVFSWVSLRFAGKEGGFSTPAKFALGIILLGCGFGALALGAQEATGGLVGLGWLVFGYYLTKTVGELFLSPVGLSMITKLSPKEMTGTMMGMWFLFTALAEKLAGEISKFTSVKFAEGALPPPTETVGVYGDVYLKIFFITGGVGVALLLLVPLLKKWMHGVK
jgi:POT family proton-dependent oligopeptide transporter